MKGGAGGGQLPFADGELMLKRWEEHRVNLVDRQALGRLGYKWHY